MRTNLAKWTRLTLVVVAIAGSQTGCKTGWKMPGSDMFPWSKKPSESTLAGSSPSMSMPNSSTSPMGPSYKNTPTPLVSSAANAGRANSPYGPAGSSGPSFNMPPNNAMANSQMVNNGAGVSAGANGYATGAYNMAGANSNANRSGFTPSSGYSAPPQSPSGYSSAPPPNSLSGLPPAYGGMPSGFPQAPSSTYPPVGNGGVQALPVGYNPGAVNAMQPQSSMPNALPSSYQPTNPANGPSVATQAYSGASPYRPGSVGRQTGYDFSNQGAGGSGFPAGVPNTANGNGLPPANSMYR